MRSQAGNSSGGSRPNKAQKIKMIRRDHKLKPPRKKK